MAARAVPSHRPMMLSTAAAVVSSAARNIANKIAARAVSSENPRMLSTAAACGVPCAAELMRNPLHELRLRSERRGLCDKDGSRLPGAPWGMQLAHASDETWPAVRTVGFQAVRSNDFTFLLKRQPISRSTLPIAINYVEGKYMKGDVCEQWRAEGTAVEIAVEDVLKTAPPASFAQILAAGARTSEGVRTVLTDPDAFSIETAALKTRLSAGEVSSEEISRSAIVYRLAPVRMELLVGGPDFPMWERFEWRRDDEGNWAEPVRILPY